MDHIFDNIWIGDAEEANMRNRLEINEIVYVVTLNSESHTYTTAHQPIEDGVNEQDEFDSAVQVVKKAFNQDDNILIHCKSGMSKSVTCVATALAERKDWNLDKSLDFVSEKRSVANPHSDLLDHAEVYLNN